MASRWLAQIMKKNEDKFRQLNWYVTSNQKNSRNIDRIKNLKSAASAR